MNTGCTFLAGTDVVNDEDENTVQCDNELTGCCGSWPDSLCATVENGSNSHGGEEIESK